ncbi:hypothetical protein COV93_06195 [Candidatus Woesearchaeota archaeon CG11_big_fil_rev_8_21_14_0_20_43_8]|nr:MAG: hypothetical protein COV93_06195 [Candidatus Woesearchaeota archaeon CG11_big_fil_rev_8_21_14_0_20_43_8]
MRPPLIRALLFGLILIIGCLHVYANPLDISNFRIYVNDEKVDPGQIIVGPGQQIEIVLKLENLVDQDIEDITITAMIDDIDDGDEIETESDEFDLEPGDTETVRLYLDIPDFVDEDSYELSVSVEAEYEDGNDVAIDDIKQTVDISLERYDVKMDAVFADENLLCDEDGTLTVTVKNIGKKDIDRLQVLVKNEELGIYILSDTIELEREGSSSLDFQFTVPEGIIPGDSQFTIMSSYQGKTDDDPIVAVLKTDCEQKMTMIKAETKVDEVETIILSESKALSESKVTGRMAFDTMDVIDEYKDVFAVSTIIMFTLLVLIFFQITRKK